MTAFNESLPPKRSLQNLCGVFFFMLFAMQFVCQGLLVYGVIPPQTVWYAYVIGACSVAGFTLLTVLASNYTCRTFALCLLAFELFFMFGRPFLLALNIDVKSDFPIVFWACLGFNIAALYLWSVLFVNCRFSLFERLRLLILPLPFVVNIMSYGGYLCSFAGTRTLASIAVDHLAVISCMRMAMALYLPFGYWLLCHNENFSGRNNDRLLSPDFSPFNRYFLSFLILTGILFIPF